jgi:hypothetical protein
MAGSAERDAPVIAATRRWIDAAVIGLGLCPFARTVVSTGRVRFRVSAATTTAALRGDLVEELRWLAGADPGQTDTTLLIHPWVLQDFLGFNDFLAEADATLARLRLIGVLQVASFHPHYRFAGTRADDPGNCTNRSPYPILHLLREASIERALAACADPDSIYMRNIATLRGLGWEGWKRLQARFAPDQEETGGAE